MATKKTNKPVKKTSSGSHLFFLTHPYLYLALLVALVYGRAMWAGLTHFDDTIFVRDMKDYNSDWGNIIESFKRGVFGSGMYYRPLLLIDFIIEYHLFGENPAGYHFTNLLFHATSVLLFFHLLIKLKTEKLTAFILAALFAVHPVLTHAVVWIPGRNDMLLSVFLLASFIFFISWLEFRKTKHLILFSLMFLLALFTKETAWLFPVVVVAYVILVAEVKLNNRGVIYAGAAMALLVSFYFLIKSQAKLETNILDYTSLDLMVARLPMIPQYIGKIFFPYNLSLVPLIEDTAIVPGCIALVLLVIIFFITGSYKKPQALFGLFWLSLFLFPLLFVLPPDTGKKLSFENPAYEHRLYIPLPGLLFFIGSVINWQQQKGSKTKFYIAGLVVAVFSVLSFTRIHHFDNALSFFKQAVNDAPHSATSKVAYASRLYGDSTERATAIIMFNEAYKLNPDERFLNFFLGDVEQKNNNPAKAEFHFRKEITNSDFAEASLSLADLLFKKQQYDSAQFYLEKIVFPNPKDALACNNLLILYLMKQDYKAANKLIRLGQQNGIEFKPDMLAEALKHQVAE